MTVRQTVIFVAAAVVPFAVSAALIPARNDLPNATLALGLAVIVTALAALGTRASAIVAAVSAGIGFDIFFTKPYGSIVIHRAEDLETTALLLVVGLIVGQIASRSRRHQARWSGVSDDLARIHSVAEMVAAGSPVDQVVLAVANELRDLLHLTSARFDEAFPDVPGPFVERGGSISWGALQWGAGLPAQEVTLVVEYQGRPLGRYALLAPAGTPVDADQLVAAVALADQAGAAIAAQGIPGP
jgi:hypothetical protein